MFTIIPSPGEVISTEQLGPYVTESIALAVQAFPKGMSVVWAEVMYGRRGDLLLVAVAERMATNDGDTWMSRKPSLTAEALDQLHRITRGLVG